ncbi:glycosyltransferase [Sphingobacterium rhinopitheci]|uniref:glycosyltransferase n=1 Tax=Sphingobacterium rhinopitheci TaxID=2781960 RepID=UPI001F51D46A|nr:glycosyltransferase [Sphingobacterium rhinopitheci]MCI0922492.1 glycosyltransferase [Sphingobacterium rhinopitheci]
MKFSILIPAYKSTFFEECINSILLQSYRDFELVILNDASPEPIEEIINIYDDDRIRYYKNEINCGALNIVDNWNKLLDLATGDFVICIGDDDKLLPDCLMEYHNMIVKYPNIDIFHGWTEIIDEDSNFSSLQECRPEIESVYSMLWHRWNGRIQYIGDFCYRKEVLQRLGGFYKLPLAWASDDITSYIVARNNGIINLPKLVFQYRVNSQTITSTGGKVYKLQAMELEYNWYKEFLKNLPDESIDRKFHTLIDNNLEWFFKKKKLLIMKMDLAKSPVKKMSFWLKNRKRYQISYLMLLKSVMDSLPIYFRISKHKV